MKSEHYYYDGSMRVYEYAYPSDIDLLTIFPESREIIPLKLREALTAKRRIIRTETKPYLNACNNAQDAFSCQFWKEVYAYLAGGFIAATANCERLERLSMLISDPEGARTTAINIARAKSIPIVTLYDFKQRRRAGRGFSALCPIHGDKDPSFHIYPDNSWHCFGCGKGGDSISFIMELHKCSFIQAMKILGGSV